MVDKEDWLMKEKYMGELEKEEMSLLRGWFEGELKEGG